MAKVNSYNVIGVGVSATDYSGACATIINAAHGKQSFTVTALAVHGVMTGALNPEHRHRLNTLDLVVPDGQPVRWALNLLFKTGLLDRVYGPNLMLRICERAAAENLSIAFYGNKIDVLEDLCLNLRASIPALKIVAAIPSQFGRISADEQADLSHRIEATGADILFVGLGCPRQEVWLYENGTRLRMPTIAVGAAFDFHAKRLAQAPRWMQDRGLEWLFRLGHEPKRLWRRYVILNPLFVSLLVLQKLGFHRSAASDANTVITYQGYA